MKMAKLRAVAVLLMAMFAVFGSTAMATAATGSPSSGVVLATSHLASTTHVGDATAADMVGPNIVRSACNAGKANWVHLYTTAGTWCYGFVGTANVPSNITLAICFGNNFGSFRTDINGNVTQITINGWSGNATCP